VSTAAAGHRPQPLEAVWERVGGSWRRSLHFGLRVPPGSAVRFRL